MGKHAQSSSVQPSVQYGAEGSVLRNIPSKPHPAERLLKTAVWWIDASHESAGGQTIQNLGWGGSVLNAQSGSTTGADSNDPKFLDWDGDNYVYLPGTSGNYMTVPDESALDITGDIDLRVKVALDDWTPAAAQGLLSKLQVSNQFSWYFYVDTTGKLTLTHYTDGTSGKSAVSNNASPLATDGSTLWLRATLDVDNGAGGNTTTFYSSLDGVSWTQVGSPVVNAGVSTIHAGTSPVEIGSYLTGSGLNLAGRVYRAQILNGINGTPVLDIDTSLVPSGSATSFPARTGQTVTINRSTSGRKSVAVTQPCWLFGTDDYMEVPDNDLLDFGASDSLTVLAAYREWATFGGFASIVAKKNSLTDATAGYALRNGSVGTAFEVADGTTVTAFGLGVVSLGSLNVAAGVRDTTADSVKLTTSSAVAAATDTTTASLVNSLPLRVSSRSTGAGNFNNMEFIAAAVFRRALTASEISLLNDYYQNRDF